MHALRHYVASTVEYSTLTVLTQYQLAWYRLASQHVTRAQRTVDLVVGVLLLHANEAFVPLR